jgi:predicted lipoprotein with Yx(FWY)xxD motif
MIERPPAALCGVLLVAGLAGCGSEAPEPEGAAPAAPVAAVTPADTGAPVATQPAVLTLGRAPEHGEFVADAGGRALYLFTADTQGSSSCYDACAQVWPPFLSPAGTPRAGSAGVEPRLIGTVQRRDGSTQVTYNGHPLYYYQKDQGPGQATGQDVHDAGGEWYLVTPQGEKLEHGGEGHS